MGGFTPRHAAQCLYIDLVTQRLAVFPEGCDYRSNLLGAFNVLVAANFVIQQLVRLDGCGFTVSLAFHDDLVEVVERIQINVIEFADTGLNVSGDGDVDGKDRPVLTRRDGCLHLTKRDNRIRTGS